MRYVLSIDVGSQSLRGCIFDQMGNLVAKVQEKYPPFKSIKTGWVEVHPEVFWQTFCKVCNKLKDERNRNQQDSRIHDCVLHRDERRFVHSLRGS